MFVDLMSATTSDGIVIDGAFFEPAQALSRQGPVDALLLIHGSGGRFYAPATKTRAQDLRDQGYACLALNTRGHDTVWVNRQDGTPYGNAYEILDTSRLDLRAGIDYLCELGYRRIGILGHSMGAVKVAYYAAAEADERVATVIPVSPVRLSYSYYLPSADAAEFLRNLEQADQMEAEGKALELMKVNFPIKEIFSAASYLDKHGPAERYNLITLAPQIKIPIFCGGWLPGDPYPPAGHGPGPGNDRCQQPPGGLHRHRRRQPLPEQPAAGGFGSRAGLAGQPVAPAGVRA
jgi:pimeloyl-ACP methyl ester carboxylesterase